MKRGNKKFLETDYPQGRAIEVFRRFHFGLLGPKTEILYFTSPRTAENGSSDLSKGEVNRKPRGRAIGELFRLKIRGIDPKGRDIKPKSH